MLTFADVVDVTGVADDTPVDVGSGVFVAAGTLVFVGAGVFVVVGTLVFVGACVAVAMDGKLKGSPGKVRELISCMLLTPSPSESRPSINPNAATFLPLAL